MGFSFLEIGTVTPLAQYGNPKPRVFRSPEQKALINRMGFGNDGSFNIAARLKKEEWNLDKIPLAINIGKNKTTVPEKAIDDYLQVLDVFKELSSFFVLNVSSPNTPGLRDLVSQEFFEELSQRIPKAALHKVWIKLDPDMDKKKFQRIVQVIAERGFQGLVLTNTHKVDWPQSGGQSGHPLSILSSARLEWAHEVHKGDLPMIASGGILSGIDIFEKLARGASAVEVYTAMVYRGPWAVKNLLKELSEELKLRGFSSVKEVIGSYY
jgi:dihydroorotate dehydrogenase